MVSIPEPQVGWWTTICCEEDLQQIETEEQLLDLMARVKEDIEDEGFTHRQFWPTKEAALRAL